MNTRQMSIRPRRSVLYMPGSNARALEKAKTLAADCLILDLEDAVAPDAKEIAREQVIAAVKGGGYGSRELIIRINGLATPWGAGDLKAAASAGAHGILLPKVQSEGDLEAARQGLWSAEAPEGLALWAMMETPLAILNAREIAADAANARHPLTAFVMGTNDLAKETRAALGGDRLPMITWLSITVAAGRAYGVDIIDGVFNSIGDDAGFRAECGQGRALGMDGKTLIHPSQIGPCNEAFSPSADEAAWARKVIAAFALPENQGKGAISLDGRMVELLHAEMARRTVAIADAIAAM
jgi:citrate lyase subunit beta / citryl-CoA lyase